MSANVPLQQAGSPQGLPRLLILSNEFPQTGTAGGLLLYRLLQSYPAHRMKVIGDVPQKESRLLECSYSTVKMPWRRFEYSRFNRMHRTLRSYGLVPLFPASEVDRVLDGFLPEVVLTVMQHGTWYDSAGRYARQRGLPLIAIVHDTNESFDSVYPWARDAQRRMDARFYKFARSRLCVSEQMEEFCYRKFGERGEVLYPNRDEALVPRSLDDCARLKSAGILTLGFVGNLSYGYGEQLVRLLPVFRKTGTRLVIYGRRPGPDCVALEQADDCVELRGFAPSNEAWAGVKRDCDGVIFPYLNPAGHMHHLYSHHFPSKLPEYLALQMPVVMVGPPEATGVQWAIKNPRAVLLDTDSGHGAIGDQLIMLKRDAELRISAAQGAAVSGAQCFDPVKIQERFLEVLAECCAQ